MNTIEALQHPQLIPYQISKMDVWEDKPYYLVRFDNGLQMKVSEKVLKIFEHLNGRNSLSSISRNISEQYEEPLQTSELESLVHHLLMQKGVIIGNEKIPEHSSAIRFRTPLFNAGRLEKLSTPFQKCFSLTGLIVFAILFLFALSSYFYILTKGTIHAHASSVSFWVITFVMIVLSALVHEFGHITAAFRYDVKPKDMGIGLFFLAPVLFVDLSNAWKASRKQRVIIDLGGIYFQLWIFILYQLFTILTDSTFIFTANHFILLSIISNLNPLLRLDGFWVLTDFLGIPNLHTRTFTLLREGFMGFVFRRQEYKAAFKHNLGRMNANFKKVFLAYSLLYLVVVSIAFIYMIRLAVSFVPLLYSWNWSQFKGLAVVLLILIVHFMIVLAKKIKRKKGKSVAPGTTGSGDSESQEGL